jgi:hypothetical protein
LAYDREVKERKVFEKAEAQYTFTKQYFLYATSLLLPHSQLFSNEKHLNTILLGIREPTPNKDA